MKWFKHDTNALHDAKIEKLIMKYGIQGYGLYFACVEIVAGNLTNENITFELEHDAEILAYKFKIDTLLVEEMMKYMCKLNLFEMEGQKIFCYKLASRIDSSLIKNKDLLKIKSKIQEKSRSLKKNQEKSSQNRLEENRLEENRKDIKKEYKDNFIPANSAHTPEKKLYREICIYWYQLHNKELTILLNPSDSDFQKSVILCEQLNNDETILRQCVETYWEKYTEMWYYQKNKKHNFKSFSSNITEITALLNSKKVDTWETLTPEEEEEYLHERPTE